MEHSNNDNLHIKPRFLVADSYQVALPYYYYYNY